MNSKLSESSMYFFRKKDRSCFWEAYCLMLGTFPKDFSQVSPSQGYLSKRAISQVCPSCVTRPTSPSLLQHSAPTAACGASEGLIPNLWEELLLGKLHIWGVGIWEIVTWKVSLGKTPLGKYQITIVLHMYSICLHNFSCGGAEDDLRRL